MLFGQVNSVYKTGESEQLPGRHTTDELMHLIRNSPDPVQTIRDQPDDFTVWSFSKLLRHHMSRAGLTVPELEQAALLSKTFLYQLLNGDRTPGRDIVIRLSIVMGLTLEEVQVMLRTAGRGALYPRLPRDAIIIHALENHKTLADVSAQLEQLKEPPLL